MVSNFVSSDIPVSNKSEVGVLNRSVISHLRLATIGVLPVGKKLVDGIESVRLDGVVGGENDELRSIRLKDDCQLLREK
jgi:hypothetical protein